MPENQYRPRKKGAFFLGLFCALKRHKKSTKLQVSNYKQAPMAKAQNLEQNKTKRYDLEERTYKFAKRCRDFIGKLPKTIANIEYGKQLIRASGSPAANYIEANESLSKKDFILRIKICRKEAKESRLWLRLCNKGNNQALEKEGEELIKEATELTKIFSSIVEKSK